MDRIENKAGKAKPPAAGAGASAESAAASPSDIARMVGTDAVPSSTVKKMIKQFQDKTRARVSFTDGGDEEDEAADEEKAAGSAPDDDEEDDDDEDDDDEEEDEAAEDEEEAMGRRRAPNKNPKPSKRAKGATGRKATSAVAGMEKRLAAEEKAVEKGTTNINTLKALIASEEEAVAKITGRSYSVATTPLSSAMTGLKNAARQEVMNILVGMYKNMKSIYDVNANLEVYIANVKAL